MSSSRRRKPDRQLVGAIPTVAPPADTIPPAIRHLLRTGLLRQQDLLSDSVSINDLSRRNENAEVAIGDGGYFVKHAIDHGRRLTLKQEARNLSLIESFGSPVLQRSVPRLISRDDETGWIVVERISGTGSLRTAIQGSTRMPTGAMRVAGRALAALHASPIPANELWDGPPELAPYSRPGLAAYMTFSRAARAFVAAVQSSDVLRSELPATEAMWTSSRPIHADLRWENIIVSRRGGKNPAAAWLVDWEFMRFGDPLWDIGCVYADALWTWINSFPTNDAAPPGHDEAGVPMSRLRRGFDAFWAAYWGHHGHDAPEDALAGTVRFAAVRLLERFFDSNATRNELDRHSVLAIQLAENLLRTPGLGADLFWGAA
jgi:aminoglycoside phosphotransferase (APT) family kinase protein